MQEITKKKGVDVILDPVLASNFEKVNIRFLFDKSVLEHELHWNGLQMGNVWHDGRLESGQGKLHETNFK